MSESDKMLDSQNLTKKSRRRDSIFMITICCLLSLSIFLTIYFLPYLLAPKLCFDKDCISFSSSMLNTMKPDADPCDNFYHYACGNWKNIHPLNPFKSSVDNFNLLKEKIDKEIFNLILSPLKTDQDSVLGKVYEYFSLCHSDDTKNDKIQSILKTFYKDTINLNVMENWNSVLGFKFSWAKSVAEAQRHFPTGTIVAISINADLHDGTRHIVTLEPGPLPLPSIFYYGSIFHKRILTEYNILIKSIFKILGLEESMALKVFQYEKTVSKIHDRSIKNSNLSELFKKIELKQIEIDTSISITELKMLLNTIFQDVQYTIDENSSIGILHIEKIKQIISIFKKHDEKTQQAIILWHSLFDVMMYFPGSLRDKFLKFKARILGVPFININRMNECVFRTKEAYTFILARLYIDKYFSVETMKKVHEISHNVMKSMKKFLQTNTWMDEETRKHALEKADSLKFLIGYPDFIKDNKLLEEYYKEFKFVKNDFLQTMFNQLKFSNNNEIKKILTKVNRFSWEFPPYEVNAFYEERRNIMMIPAGILRAPFFNPGAPDVVNYGTVGLVLSHELAHAFDNQGRRFDVNGNYESWWTSKSDLEYQNRSSCLIKKYNSYHLAGQFINGKKTLNENIADQFGIMLPFMSFKENGGFRKSERLPGLNNMTPEQLYFLSYGQIWCSTMSMLEILRGLENDPHSNEVFRVNGVVSNFQEFSKAYNCKVGTKMNPIEKCSME